MDKINDKIARVNLESLKEMAVLLFNDNRDGTEIVLSAVLGKLESIMPETDFIAFCETI